MSTISISSAFFTFSDLVWLLVFSKENPFESRISRSYNSPGSVRYILGNHFDYRHLMLITMG